MDCQRHKENLTDAALGALEPAREAELAAHLAACAECRAALEDERRLFAAVDRGIAANVAGEPSPEFAVRVRQRVEQETLRTQPWFAWWMPAAAGVVAVLILVAVWFTRRESPTPGKRPPEATVADRQRPPETPVAPPQRAATQPPAARGSGQAPKPRGLMAVNHNIGGRVARATEPEVLVPREELAAALHFYEALRKGRVDTASLLAQAVPLERDELKIAPLEIAALDEDGKQPASPRDR